MSHSAHTHAVSRALHVTASSELFNAVSAPKVYQTLSQFVDVVIHRLVDAQLQYSPDLVINWVETSAVPTRGLTMFARIRIVVGY